MTPDHWTPNELEAIGAADEMRIAPRRPDGTLTPCTTIWVVRVGDDLYVRSYRGPSGSWYRAAQLTGRGRISVGGVERDVTFERHGVEADVDQAYRAKYGRSTYVDAMLTAETAATTLRLVPAE